MSNLCDGSTYIANLSSFIKSHEKQLANALLAYKKSSGHGGTGTLNNHHDENNARKNVNHKPVRLSLTLHHLYFLLDSFNQINLKTGPLNIRLYDIDHHYIIGYNGLDNTTTNNNSHPVEPVYEQQEYVSFLSNNYYNSKSKRLSSYSSSVNSNDNASITSMSSMKSALSSIWNSMSINGYNGTGSPYDNNFADNPVISNHLKYLYSCFTKLPCLRISPDLNSKLIKNYQEFPFDTIVPLTIFKNLSILEINEINPKELFGWHNLAENLKFLIIKNFDLNNKIEMVLMELLWQDYNNRNHKLINANYTHNYTNSLPNSLPNSPVSSTFNEKKKLNKKRHKSFANIRKKRNSIDVSKKSQLADNNNNHHNYHSIDNHTDFTSFKNPFYQNKWKNLKYLSFSNTSLTSIDHVDAFRLLENLNSLDLSGNKFTEVPICLKYLVHLKSLNLSDNLIHDLSNFKYFTSEENNSEFSLKGLTLINLKHNEITNLNGLEFLLNLIKVDLSYNKINYLKDLRSLFLSGIEITAPDPNPLSIMTNGDMLYFNNIEKLDDLQNFEKVTLFQNEDRSTMDSLNLIGNPLQNFDKNYRIKLFNLCKVFNWVRSGFKINGSAPSYLESYYLLSDSEDENDIFNTDAQLFINFKKYLFDYDDYFHQYKPGSSIEAFLQQDRANVNRDLLNNASILKSISNYSLHIFAKDETEKKRVLQTANVSADNSDKENIIATEPSREYQDPGENVYLVDSMSKLELHESAALTNKHFPETFDTKPIPVNIQDNKLYLNSSRYGGHSQGRSISIMGSQGDYFTTSLSPTSVSYRNNNIAKGIECKSGDINYSTNHIGTTSPKPIKVATSMSTSKSLNNLLNLSQSLHIDGNNTTDFNLRANAAFDSSRNNNNHSNRLLSRHERAKSAVSYHSTHTLTD
ncbi:hypothetical protein DASC09_014280 [Saccharomycopsis crataegensis]|uniref:Leucine-rich repeat-containing protein n=1 Tax=Saccharomycopsis crataegensis TaxID=43959 RepID=A0AAV5QH54_9ASCO|nr:hypothetical protein DASC09_014280 [Saccharomycopsis crataegensis]